VLLERGVILPKRRAPLRHRLHELMAGELPISPRVIRLLEDLRDEWASLEIPDEQLSTLLKALSLANFCICAGDGYRTLIRAGLPA
jgi:hypothetical protein